jgi:hypothetical protein
VYETERRSHRIAIGVVVGNDRHTTRFLKEALE